ncbi:MAG: Helix-turn-helix domain [Clostridia bacterium]|jgi:excisionase family DNA binding protein|nr:Helix-turn-helix domain [Clostridia bacterium]
MNDQILNLKESAIFLGCGLTTLRKLVRLKEINYFMIGNRYYFRKQTLENWILNMENENRKINTVNQEVIISLK